MNMKYIIGLDQGGTKTVAVVSDLQGHLLSAGYADGSLHSSNGMAHSMERATEAIGEALKRANAESADVLCLHSGMTGADFPYEYELLREALIAATGIPDVRVENDCIIAYRAGTSSATGAVLCIGTGTNAAVVRQGAPPFVYGYHIRDEDSGGEALGNLALRAALDSEVGLERATDLKRLILGRYGLDNTDELMEGWIQGKLGSRKHLVPLIFEAAEAGDEVAVRLIVEFGTRNAKYVTAGLRHYGVPAQEAEIVLSGSLFKARSPLLRTTVEEELKRHFPSVRIIHSVYEPVVGAALLALDRLNGEQYPLDSRPLADSVRELGLIRLP